VWGLDWSPPSEASAQTLKTIGKSKPAGSCRSGGLFCLPKAVMITSTAAILAQGRFPASMIGGLAAPVVVRISGEPALSEVNF
jgi:hypothetical protein